jgi:hypothetical protein
VNTQLFGAEPRLNSTGHDKHKKLDATMSIRALIQIWTCLIRSPVVQKEVLHSIVADNNLLLSINDDRRLEMVARLAQNGCGICDMISGLGPDVDLIVLARYMVIAPCGQSKV